MIVSLRKSCHAGDLVEGVGVDEFVSVGGWVNEL